MKQAQNDHPIHELIAARWSPYAFADRPVSPADLRSLFEAARWAPSSFNEQPWRYCVATRDDSVGFARLLSCLTETNQVWAKHASVLVMTVVSEKLARNGKPNAVALHDVGLASANLSIEATARGLAVHQMGGILPDRAREVLGIPDDHRAATALAIGYAAAGTAGIDPEIAERDARDRTRRTLREFVFGTTFGEPSELLG